MPSSCAGHASALLTPRPATLLAPIATICAAARSENWSSPIAIRPATSSHLGIANGLPPVPGSIVRQGARLGNRSCRRARPSWQQKAGPEDPAPLIDLATKRSAVKAISSRLLPPDVFGKLHAKPQLGPLLFLAEDIALLGRGEAALRRQRQLLQRGEFRSLLHAALDV